MLRNNDQAYVNKGADLCEQNSTALKQYSLWNLYKIAFGFSKDSITNVGSAAMPAINAVVDPSLCFLIIDRIYREILAWENVI